MTQSDRCELGWYCGVCRCWMGMPNDKATVLIHFAKRHPETFR